MINPSVRQPREALGDSLLAIAAALPDAGGSEEVLNLLTGSLAERGVACALLSQAGRDLLLERSTLPLPPEVWGRPLKLGRLAAALARGRPEAFADIADAFSETASDGKRRSLLAEGTGGVLIVAPLRLGRERSALLCLASNELAGGDTAAAWGLALQLGVALRATPANGHAAGAPARPVQDLSLFHELTRRISYSLNDEEVVRTGLEVLAPALEFEVAASVLCAGREHTTTVFASQEPPDALAEDEAAAALEAFRKLAGGKHRDCERAPPQRAAIEGALSVPGRPLATMLDAPLVTEGEVTGILRVGASTAGAFAGEKERTFYTVANQLSLALERLAAQRRAERAHIASLADSLTDGIVLVDAGLGVTAANRAAQELLAELGAPQDSIAATPLEEMARRALSQGRPTPALELTPSASAVSQRYVSAMAAPLAGSPEGSAAVVILRDVTEERLMQERLLQSEKMVSVGQLVSGVAHELNNPLTGIMGFAQLLLGRDIDAKVKNDVQTIYTEAERAAKIVENLLDFARRKRAQKELANVNDLLQRVLELRTYDLRVKNIELELDLDAKLPETMVDANQIQQVLFNVLVNAEQAMLSEHGKGTLKVRSRRHDGAIQLSFQDDGPGIPPETLRRIFDPFYTTKDTGEGTGLGLTISYGIIDEHGGRIWADSRPGRGTTFYIELPIVQGAEQPAAPSEQETETSVAARSVLVVDDEESIQRLLGSILEMDGHRVDTARNGREALERINKGRYDLVITDIKMPDMDGRALHERLQQTDPRLAQRTIFITGDTVSRDTRDFLQRVTNPCLAKPFKVREVRDTIARIFEA